MPNEVRIHDDFTTLPADVDVIGRVPPVTDSGQAWKREGSTWVRGDGAGNLKFSASNAAIKMTALIENCAVRVIWNAGGAANSGVIFIGDNAPTTVYPRYAYGAFFYPPESYVAFARFDNFNFVQLGSNIPVTFAGGDETWVFQRNGNTFEGLVNGTVVGSFTDSTYPTNGLRRHHGWSPIAYADGNGRLKEFTILDSVTPTAAPEAGYPIMECW